MLESGIGVANGDANIEWSIVRDTKASEANGSLGDGITLFAYGGPSSATLSGVRVESSARASLSSFGGAATLQGIALACAAFDIDVEAYEGKAFSLTSLGGNACGCPDPVNECKAQSAKLAPPVSIPAKDDASVLP